MTGPPIVSPASQFPGDQVEITIPVNPVARYAYVYVGDDVSGWSDWMGSVDGNWNGEGRLVGTGYVPYPPASGNYSIWVTLYDDSWNASSVYVADATISATDYTTWDSSDGTARESTIPLAFLEVVEAAFVDLSATIDFVPGTGGAGDVNYTIRNTGTIAAGPFVAGIFVNPESLPQSYQVPDRWLEYEGLAAGAEVAGTIPVSGLPETVTRVHALVDLTASISEWDDGNNLATDVHRWGVGTSYENTTPVAITDNSWAYSPLDVSGWPASILDATVILNITHTSAGDLVAYLVSPSGTWVNLVAYRGGSDDNFTGTVFDDGAATAIWDGAAPFTGNFRPEGPLGTLAGEDGNGTWTLSIYDAASGEIGTIDSWTLTLW
jgi:subtilisin-like proprotein convertase family protein